MDLRPPDQVLAYVALVSSVSVLESSTGHSVNVLASVAQSGVLLLLVFGYFALLAAIEATHVCLHEMLDEDEEPAA